jgi:hypothetical protein
MRCSRFAYTLVTVVIAVGTIGIASASSRTGVAAEFGANPIFWQTANRFESVKDWRTFKIMEELVNVRTKNSFLLSLPYKIMIAQVGNYASKSNSTIDGESINLRSIFSSKMLTLLSTRWNDKTSSTVESLAVEVDNNKQGMIENTENPSTSVSDAATNSDNFSVYDLLRGDWAILKLSNTNYFDSYFGIRSPNPNLLPADDNEKAYPSATPAKSIPDGERNSSDNESMQQLFDSSSFYMNDFDDFIYGEIIDSKYSPQFNGSFGYPFHAKTNWTVPNGSEDDRIASWQTNLDFILSDLFASEGYAEEQYSVTYGNTVEDINQPEPPQSLQGELICDSYNLAQCLSIYYYGSNNTIGSTKSENGWENMAFINSTVSAQIGSEMMFFDNSTTLHSDLSSGFNHSGVQIALPTETDYVNLTDKTPTKESASTKTTPGAFFTYLVYCFKLETNKWTSAIKHIAVQFSMLHDIF